MPRTARAPERPGVSQSLRLSAARESRAAPPILVAGADSVQRAAVLAELAHTLPEGTCFEEASAFWEVLARSTRCRMVVFSGDLEDGAAEEFMHTLGQRRPELPAVNLNAQPLSRA